MARTTDSAKEMQVFLERFLLPENLFLEKTVTDPYVLPRNILKEFIISKRAEGCSMETLRSYFTIVRQMLITFSDKPLSKITGSDIKAYLMNHQATRHVTNATLDNIRRTLNSFFNFMCCEDYIDKNPMMKVHKIKSDSILKLPFSEEELERIRDACGNIFELSLVDFLYSTGVRVSECVNADISDFDFQSMEGVVYGKGGKERKVYMDMRTKIHLERYLKYRKDSSPALFVTLRPPHNRLSKTQVEYYVRNIGAHAHVENVHPHRFRRTLATRLLERGMPIEQVQSILGHQKVDTTLIYAKVNQTGVKMNHQKYV